MRPVRVALVARECTAIDIGHDGLDDTRRPAPHHRPQLMPPVLGLALPTRVPHLLEVPLELGLKAYTSSLPFRPHPPCLPGQAPLAKL